MGAKALKAALDRTGVDAADLALVIAAGMSRDYLPSWSLSTEMMRLVGCSDRALGLDLTVGCLGAMVALNLARGWLSGLGGGLAAVVAVERWAYTVDRSSTASMSLWGHSDGGGALVVEFGSAGKGPRYLGSEFVTYADMNGRVLIKFGGTRFPSAPPDSEANFRVLDERPATEVRRQYIEGYQLAFDRIRRRFNVAPSRLVCNQITPGLVKKLPELAGVEQDRTVVTGHQHGHLGSGDLVVGLHRLLDDGGLDTPVALAASTPYAFGAGLIVPAGTTP
jgi:3-oxoacyl-[acyl-carrier-protein] synthase III